MEYHRPRIHGTGAALAIGVAMVVIGILIGAMILEFAPK